MNNAEAVQEQKRRGYAPLEGKELQRVFLLNERPLSRWHIQKLIDAGIATLVEGERKNGATRGKVPMIPVPTGKGRQIKAVLERHAKRAAEKAKVEAARLKAEKKAQREAKKAAKAPAPVSTGTEAAA